MDFDPYYKWLAIPPAEQPPNHYRLLGVPLFTDDPDVIENAADQRMSHLRSLQSGKHSQDSQRLLNEVAAARGCLLNATKKSEYDTTLRRATTPARPQPLPVARPISSPPISPPLAAQPPMAAPVPVPQPVAFAPAPRPAAAKRKAKESLLADIFRLASAPIVGLGLGFILLAYLKPEWDRFGWFHRQPVVAIPASNPAKVQPAPKPEVTKPKPAIEPKPSPPIEKPSPPIVAPMPIPPSPPQPTAEELAQQAATERAEKLARLQADRDAAIAAGKVLPALKLTSEVAQLAELDPRTEKLRVVDELCKTDHPPAETFILTGAMMEHARHLLTNNQKPQATERATAALQLARKTADQDLIRQATRLVLEIQQQE
ncbi:hypothetical protein [Anatilimnocola floriformis]|uniref:hypothetical protein n=1 Tax=Anatilimnocola floriformis TaxID=2948575 RepID=UPI0020C378FD|nr:hypothetical protein [Anatilimnocola floriformis]